MIYNLFVNVLLLVETNSGYDKKVAELLMKLKKFTSVLTFGMHCISV